MNHETIFFILGQCVRTYRKELEPVRRRVVGDMAVTEINTDPHESQAPERLVKVDVHFFIVGVDRDRALECRPGLIQALMGDADMLKRGPSYLTIAHALGDQQAALMLMGLGAAIGLWGVVTPAMLRIPPEQQERAAGVGYVMISGFRTGPFEEGNDNGNREPQQHA